MCGAEKSRRVERMAGTTKTFRLVKHHASGGVVEIRVIAMPVAGTV